MLCQQWPLPIIKGEHPNKSPETITVVAPAHCWKDHSKRSMQSDTHDCMRVVTIEDYIYQNETGNQPNNSDPSTLLRQTVPVKLYDGL